MTQGNILIIEDEQKIAEWVRRYFERAGFSAFTVADGREGLDMAREQKPDLIILDLMLPGLDGFSICRTLRRESDVPIIMLTAKGTQPDRIDGLDIGADDYIVKPFDPEEVVARAKAVLRRTKGQILPEITCGMISINPSTMEVKVENRPVSLSAAQFALLKVFMEHPNQVLSRTQLIELAFDNDFDGFDRAIDTHIRRLRKLVQTSAGQPIETVYGAGYKLAVEGA